MVRMRYIFASTPFFKYGKYYDVIEYTNTLAKAKGNDGNIHIISLSCFER